MAFDQQLATAAEALLPEGSKCGSLPIVLDRELVCTEYPA